MTQGWLPACRGHAAAPSGSPTSCRLWAHKACSGGVRARRGAAHMACHLLWLALRGALGPWDCGMTLLPAQEGRGEGLKERRRRLQAIAARRV